MASARAYAPTHPEDNVLPLAEHIAMLEKKMAEYRAELPCGCVKVGLEPDTRIFACRAHFEPIDWGKETVRI